MKLIRYAHPQSQVSNALNRLFDLGAPNAERFGSFLDDLLGADAGFNQPRVDLYEDEHSFYARFELPGIAKDQIELELENAVLSISRAATDSENSMFPLGQFQRSISVPDGIDSKKVSATANDGVLTVTMPKLEARKPRQISVN